MADGLVETLDPLLLLLLAGGGHSVHGVLTLDHLALRIRFAGLDDFGAAAGVQLEAELLAAVLHLADRNIFERDNSPRFLVGGIFKVVQTIIVQDEPSSLPRFVSSALLPQPALLVRVEERMHQVVAIVLWYLERLCPNGFIQRLQQFSR